jgi:cytoskeletal protein CcmA (bactofilin family)
VALVVALAAWLAVPGAARADWSIVGNTVASGQVIDNDVLAHGTNVVIDGTINGDLWAVGSTITVNGPVSGSLVAAGTTVTLNGEVGGSTYVVGRTLNLGETAYVRHNVHFAGLLLDSRAGSRMGRDLVAASVRGRVSSQVGRALKAVILLLTFDGQIGGGIDLLGPDSQSSGPPLAGPVGTLLGVGFGVGGGYGLDYAVPGLEILATSLAPLELAQQEEGGTSATFPKWLVARLSDLVILLLLGGLVIWLRPALIQGPAEHLRRKPLRAAGLGLLIALLALCAVPVLIMLAVLLLIAGIWLGSATLWTPIVILWCIAYSALILACALFAVTILYGSKIIVADLVGSLILRRLAPRAMEHPILPLLLGVVLYVLLRSIPIVGWPIEAIVTIVGLGAVWIAFRQRRRPQAAGVAEQVQPEPAVES